jgi:hypothetical protein
VKVTLLTIRHERCFHYPTTSGAPTWPHYTSHTCTHAHTHIYAPHAHTYHTHTRAHTHTHTHTRTTCLCCNHMYVRYIQLPVARTLFINLQVNLWVPVLFFFRERKYCMADRERKKEKIQTDNMFTPINRTRLSVSNNLPPRANRHFLGLSQCFANFFHPHTHPNLSKAHDGTPQNFASRKGGFETMHGQKYLSAKKSLPYKNAGIWKQNTR